MRCMLHLEKKGIRSLGIAESFKKDKRHSILAGVVMRSDLVVDGLALESVTIRGLDATEAILKLYKKLDRDDINIVMLGGLIISMYNIIDIDEVYKSISKPIIAITFKSSKGLDESIKRAFPIDYHRRLELYHKLGIRYEVILKNGYKVYVRTKGIELNDAKLAINKFLLQGTIPEPIRVAKLIARTCEEYIAESC